MSQVFVANGTHQHQQFIYRVPESPSVRRLEIPAGRQAKFNEDFTDGQLPHIITQLERFGAVPQSDVKAITAPRTLVYSVNKQPIAANKLDEARELDEAARQEVAAQQTENAGLALLSTSAQHTNPDAIKSTSLEVTQLSDQGDDPVKGGVDVEIGVSRSAGKMQTGKRTG